MHPGLDSPDAVPDAVRTVSKGLPSSSLLLSSSPTLNRWEVQWMGTLLSLGPRHGSPGLETSMVGFGWVTGEMSFAPSGKMTGVVEKIAASEAEDAGQA